MTDSDLARLLTIAADALDAESRPPLASDTIPEYTRNDALQVIARAFRQEAHRLTPPADDRVECMWCLTFVQTGQPRIIHHTTGAQDDAEVYHAACWDRKLHAENTKDRP